MRTLEVDDFEFDAIGAGIVELLVNLQYAMEDAEPDASPESMVTVQQNYERLLQFTRRYWPANEMVL